MSPKTLLNRSHNEDANARFNPAARTLGGNPIVVWTMSGSSSYKDRWEVTGSVFHELGHATHWQAVINKRGANRWDDYHFANNDLTESWARGVQSAYMRSLYSDYLQSYSSNLPNYTAVVESMMYQGLTLRQIENTMVGERTIEA